MNAPMQRFQNALAYFVMVVSYARKMFMTLSPAFTTKLENIKLVDSVFIVVLAS